MKYLRYIIFLMVLIIPIKVNAKITFDCNPKTINPGKTVACRIESDYAVSSFKSVLTLDPKVYYDGKVDGAGFNGSYLNTTKTLTFTSSSGGYFIGTVNIYVPSENYKSDANFNITFSGIEYTLSSQPGNTITQSNSTFLISVKIPQTTTKSTTTTTKANVGTAKQFQVILDPNGGSGGQIILPPCETTGKSCKVTLNKVQTPTKSGFTFNGWGTKTDCTEGNKTSYDATANTTLYACWVVEKTNTTTTTSSGSVIGNETLYLNELIIEGQEIAFSKFKYDYDLMVLYEVETLNITATAVKQGVVVTVSENAKALVLGENTIIISLADTEGNKNTYQIKVTRLNEGEEIHELSSDANLKALSISGYQINFSPQTVKYFVSINPGVSSLAIFTEAAFPAATVEITGNENLKAGSIIKITVTAEDKITTNTYEIEIAVKSLMDLYSMYIYAGGGVVLLLLIVIVLKKRSGKKPKTPKPPKGSVAPKPGAEKAPLSAQPKPLGPPPGVKPADPKSQVEVLDV